MPKCSDLLQLGAANHTPRGKAMLVKIQRRVEGKENEHINNSLQPMLEGLLLVLNSLYKCTNWDLCQYITSPSPGPPQGAKIRDGRECP